MNQPDLPRSVSTPIVRQAFLKQLKGLTLVNKAAQIFVGGILPILEGIFVNLATGADAKVASLFWNTIILLGILHLALLVLILLFDQPLPQFIVEFDDLANELQSAKQTLSLSENSGTQKDLAVDTYAYCSFSAELSLLAINQYLHIPNVVKDQSFYDKIFDPWVSSRQQIFWFSSDDEYYNFALYFYDPTDKKLKVKWRKHGSKLTPRNREWNPGNGHLGVCFATDSTKFCDSVQVEVMTSPKSRRPEDSTYYKSFLAEPLRLNNAPVAVLIVTSSKEKSFDENVHPIIIRLMARILEATL
jgi:hypothetical protein